MEERRSVDERAHYDRRLGKRALSSENSTVNEKP